MRWLATATLLLMAGTAVAQTPATVAPRRAKLCPGGQRMQNGKCPEYTFDDALSADQPAPPSEPPPPADPPR